MTQLELPFDDEPSPEASSPGYLTVAEAAGQVRCHERTIRRAIDRGALRVGRVRGANAARGAYRIRPIDLDRWLFTDEHGGTP